MTDAPENSVTPPTSGKKERGCLFYGCAVAAAVGLVVLVTALVTAWWVRRQVYATPIAPTELTVQEQQVLERKLDVLQQAAADVEPPSDKLITITEKEVNGLLANNTELGDKCYIALEADAVAARCNIPVPADAPFLGGKTLRGKVKLTVMLEAGRLAVRVRDVTVGGISLPNAWLGGVKNVDIVEEYFADDAVLKAFLAGIEDLELEEGQLRMVLAE